MSFFQILPFVVTPDDLIILSGAGIPSSLAVSCPMFTTGIFVGQPMIPVAVTATGGVPPYNYSASGLPNGIVISSIGVISGTPTVPGTANYTITVQDSAAAQVQIICSISVGAAALTASCPLVNGQVNVPLVPVAMIATGGIPPYTFSAVGLPAGIAMLSTGIITGTASSIGNFPYTTTITDSLSTSIQINCTALITPVGVVVVPEPVYFTTLWREDERMLTAANQRWSVDEGQPEMYSVMAPPPLQLQLAPPPQVSGTLELISVKSASIDPASSATVLPIPDDLTPAITWGALSDLLGKDGIARDPIRAQYCEQRYRQYVMLARVIPVIIHAEINGLPLIPMTIQEEDSANPEWQNVTASPFNQVSDLIIVSRHLIALSAVPDDQYSVTMDVVRKTPTYTDNEVIQIGREQLDAIMDYAEHLALFKVGGAEWHATERQSQNMVLQAMTYNQRLAADARASVSAAGQSTRQKHEIPRRLDSSAIGVGALKTGPNDGR